MLRGYLTPTGFAPGLALVLATALTAPHAAAQTEQTDRNDTIDEIVVTARTGSRIQPAERFAVAAHDP